MAKANCKHDSDLRQLFDQHTSPNQELKFLNSVFGFLSRQTNYFTTNEKQNEKRMKTLCGRFFRQAATSKKKAAEAAKMEVDTTSAPAAPPKVEPDPPKVEAEPAKEKPDKAKKDDDSESESSEDSQNRPRPVDNGGTVEGKYVWSQTLEELEVKYTLPATIKGKQLCEDRSS